MLQKKDITWLQGTGKFGDFHNNAVMKLCKTRASKIVAVQAGNVISNKSHLGRAVMLAGGSDYAGNNLAWILTTLVRYRIRKYIGPNKSNGTAAKRKKRQSLYQALKENMFV